MVWILAWSFAPTELPGGAAAPLQEYRSSSPSVVPPDGVVPLEGPTPSTPERADSTLLPDGLAPLARRPATPAGPPSPVVEPLGRPPRTARAPLVDPMKLLLVRLDLMFGPMWRIRRVDTLIASSIEVGRKHGFSAAFHTQVMVDTQRESVRAIDVPIGFGAIARGFLRNRPLSGSVGLSVGMLVHRARTERGVIHRVDPDFRLPIRFAWTIASVGLSLVIEQGYSVRNRNYERRGIEVWARHAYRVGFAIGLHSDIMAGRATHRRPGHRKRRRV